MNTPSVAAHRPPHRRKIHYVDETLQKFLLIGLVMLEAGLAAGLAWLMFRHLNQIIDDNLYRVHLADAVPIINQLTHAASILLGLFCAVNLVALAVVDLLWRRHVDSILRHFMRLVGKTRALDFTIDPTTGNRHLLLNLAETQREQDRTRLTKIRQQLALMPGASDSRRVYAVLDSVDQLLPRLSLFRRRQSDLGDPRQRGASAP